MVETLHTFNNPIRSSRNHLEARSHILHRLMMIAVDQDGFLSNDSKEPT